MSLASETELSEVINFLSGLRPRGNPDDADTESMCSTMALSDSGIESVHNAKLGVAGGKAGGSAEMDDQTKGKKGKKKDKKAATKSESFNKKKKKKRSDRKKEKKKAAAEEQENEGKKEDMNTITEGSGAVAEQALITSKFVGCKSSLTLTLKVAFFRLRSFAQRLRSCSKIRHVKCSEMYLNTNRNHSQQKPLRRREQRVEVQSEQCCF